MNSSPLRGHLFFWPRFFRRSCRSFREPRSESDLDSLVEIPGRLRGHASSAPAPAPRPQASPAATAERAEARPPVADPDVEAVADEELLDELSDEPINRGLLLKFLSSVKN